jgi:phosphate starvation-inducible PhoH-like protein
LPFGQKSGLAVAVKILENIDDIVIHSFTDRDVVRHKLVQKIILAYEKSERAARERQNEKNADRRYRPKKDV